MEKVAFGNIGKPKERNLNRFDDKLKRYSYGGVSPDELVMITTSKKIDEEYRFFIVDREVIAGCTYMLADSHEEIPNTSKEAFNLADKIAKIDWRPAEAFVIDICRRNDNYRVLEINSFNCSDIYACDPEIIVKKVNDFIEKK